MMYYEYLETDYTEQQLTEFANLEDFSNGIELRPSLNTEKKGDSPSISLSIGAEADNDLAETADCPENHEIKHDSAASSEADVKTLEPLSAEPTPEDIFPSDNSSDKYPDSEKSQNNSSSRQSHDLNLSRELNDRYESGFEFTYKNSSINSKEAQDSIENKKNVIRELKTYLDSLFPSMEDLIRFLVSKRYHYCFDISQSLLLKLVYTEYHPEKYILDRYSSLDYDKCLFQPSYNNKLDPLLQTEFNYLLMDLKEKYSGKHNQPK